MTDSRATRGRTRAGRMALLDPWLVEVVATRRVEVVVDVGLGARPDTTVELHRALQEQDPRVRTIGLDVDPERVAALAALNLDGIEPVVGGFDTRLSTPVGLVRAVNLLRQYRLDQVGPSLRAMGRWLRPGGLLVEGTTDKEGRRGCFRVFERGEWDLEPWGLVFVCDAARGFDPRALTPYLPRGMGWHGHPGPAVEPLFDRWSAAASQVRGEGIRAPNDVWAQSGRRLGAHPVGDGCFVVPCVDDPPALLAEWGHR